MMKDEKEKHDTFIKILNDIDTLNDDYIRWCVKNCFKKTDDGKITWSKPK